LVQGTGYSTGIDLSSRLLIVRLRNWLKMKSNRGGEDEGGEEGGEGGEGLGSGGGGGG
jgi:hypothetical protein